MATGYATVAALADSYKIRWPEKKLAAAFFDDCQTAKLIPIEEFAGQDDMRLVVQYASPQGRSADYATALQNVSTTEQVAFRLSSARDYGIIELSTEAILAGKSAEALVDTMSNQTETLIYTLKRQFALDIFGDGGGEFATVASLPVAGQIKLTNVEDFVNIEKNKVFVASSNKSGASPNRTGSATVTAVDPDNNIVYYSGTITGLAAGDLLFQQGDYKAKIKGFAAWNPIVAPTAGDNFFNVDRSADVARLSGWRMTAIQGNAFEQVEAALTLASRRGSKPDVMVCGTAFASAIRRHLGNLIRLDKFKTSFGVDVELETFAVAGRRVTIVEDFQCPAGILRFFKRGTVKLYVRGKKMPIVLNMHGSDLYPHPSRDTYIMRIGYFGQLGCTEPIHLGVVTGV